MRPSNPPFASVVLPILASMSPLVTGCLIASASPPDADAGGTSGGDAGTSADGASTSPHADAGGPTPDGGGAVVGTGCDGVDPANHTRDTATAYTFGTNVRGCVREGGTEDFYQFTVPATPVKGGYVVVGITDVAPDLAPNLDVQSGADNGEVHRTYTTDPGASVFAYFAAKAGATFRLRVGAFGSLVGTRNAYTVHAAFAPVADEHAGNLTRDAATPIVAGAPARGYFFAGYETANAPEEAAWYAWYKVDLGAGTAKVEISDVAPDIAGQTQLYDADGVEIESQYETTHGANVVLTHAVPGGTYYVRVQPWSPPDVAGDTATVPAFFTQPYTLVVTSQ